LFWFYSAGGQVFTDSIPGRKGMPSGGAALPVQQLWQFTQVFGGKDGEREVKTVVAEGSYVFLHFYNNSFYAAGAGSAESSRVIISG